MRSDTGNDLVRVAGPSAPAEWLLDPSQQVSGEMHLYREATTQRGPARRSAGPTLGMPGVPGAMDQE
jgi:hypothetical protein